MALSVCHHEDDAWNVYARHAGKLKKTGGHSD